MRAWQPAHDGFLRCAANFSRIVRSLAESSSFSGGMSLGGGGGGSLNITSMIHAPRAMGCVRLGPEFMLNMAAFVMMPP